jgi:hypothetical protein
MQETVQDFLQSQILTADLSAELHLRALILLLSQAQLNNFDKRAAKQAAFYFGRLLFIHTLPPLRPSGTSPQGEASSVTQ